MLIPGKPITKKYCAIELKFSVGLLAGDQWTPLDFDNKLSVKINNVDIFCSKVSSTGTWVTGAVEDISTSSISTLKIALERIDQSTGQSPLIRIEQFKFEDLNLMELFEIKGYGELDGCLSTPSEYIGQIGWYAIDIQTPVYRWLLENFSKPSIYE